MNWPHIHLALNHVPVLGIPFLLLLLLVAVWRGSEELKRVSLQGLLLLAVVSIPIKFTGDFAHEALTGWPGIEPSRVLHHEETADQATTGIFVTGLVALTALIVSRRGKPVPAWAIRTVLVVALLTFALLVRTAMAGGEIRHPEVRAGTGPPSPPVPEAADR